MRYSFRSLVRPLAVIAIGLAPSAAFAQPVLTFAGVACAGGPTITHQTDNVASPYHEAGFTLVASGGLAFNAFGTWCANSPNYAGPGLFINYNAVTASLTKDGGGAFSIEGISLAHAFAGTVADQSVTFTGIMSGGGSISQTFVIGPNLVSGQPVFNPYVFLGAGWLDLSSVTFASQLAPYYQFTNVALDPGPISVVPEPASMALLGTGLVGVFGVVARRRRNESA